MFQSPPNCSKTYPLDFGRMGTGFMDTSKTTGKQREKRVGGATGKGFQPGDLRTRFQGCSESFCFCHAESRSKGGAIQSTYGTPRDRDFATVQTRAAGRTGERAPLPVKTPNPVTSPFHQPRSLLREIWQCALEFDRRVFGAINKPKPVQKNCDSDLPIGNRKLSA
jgi:hypothetical protein